MTKSVQSFVAVSLALFMTILAFSPEAVQAKAKNAKLATKKLSMTVGQKKSIKILSKKKKATYTYKSSSAKVATVNKKGKITAVKAGKAKIKVKEKLQKKVRTVGTVTVKVKAKKSAVKPTAKPTTAPSVVPSASPTVTPTQSPAPTVSPTVAPSPATENYNAPKGFDSSSQGTTYGVIKKVNYYSTTTEKSRKVNVLLPANYDSSKKYPVLYLLHGIGGNQDEWLGGNPKQVVGNLVASGEAKEMIVVMPNVRASAVDSVPSNLFTLEHFQAFDRFIEDLRDNLMPFMQENYSVATGRENTAIAGLSMGGRESLYIGLNMPETFGYIGAFSPAFGCLSYGNNGVDEPGLFTDENFKLPDTYKDNTLVLIVNGKNDSVVHKEPERYHTVLEANGTPHIYYTIPGDHDFPVWKNGLYNFAKRIFK